MKNVKRNQKTLISNDKNKENVIGKERRKMDLKSLLEHFDCGLETIIIFNKEENIEDKFTLSEIPEEWFDKEVIDWCYNGKLFVTI